MFRSEPNAAFHTSESTRPDPKHAGVSFIERSYFLRPGSGGGDVELSRGFGEAIAAGQATRPQPMGRAAGRYWWLFRDVVYSTPDRLSRAAVVRLAEGERDAERERLATMTRGPIPQRSRPRIARGQHVTA